METFTRTAVVILLAIIAFALTSAVLYAPEQQVRNEGSEKRYLWKLTNHILWQKGIRLPVDQRVKLGQMISCEYPCTPSRAFLICKPPRRTPEQVIREKIDKMKGEQMEAKLKGKR